MANPTRRLRNVLADLEESSGHSVFIGRTSVDRDREVGAKVGAEGLDGVALAGVEMLVRTMANGEGVFIWESSEGSAERLLSALGISAEESKPAGGVSDSWTITSPVSAGGLPPSPKKT